jgi:hypothetical protein
MMALGLEFYIDPLCFGLNIQVGCVTLWVSFPKYPRSLKSEFRAKSCSHFSVERSVTTRVWLVPASSVESPVNVFNTSRSDRTHRESDQWWPDVSGHQKSSLEPLWKWPDSRRVKSSRRRKVSPVSYAEARWWPDTFGEMHPHALIGLYFAYALMWIHVIIVDHDKGGMFLNDASTRSVTGPRCVRWGVCARGS